MKRLICLLIAATITLCCCSCDRNEQSSSGSGHSFAYAIVGNPDTLDPQLAQNAAAKQVLCNLFEGLFVMGTDGTVQNGVAKEYTISDDGLTYTFLLRDDCYWYDAFRKDETADLLAEPVNAMDFVFAFERLFDPLYASPYREQYRCIAGADAIIDGTLDASNIGVFAKKTYELEIRLDTPNADFLYLLAQPPAMPCRESYFHFCKGRYGLDEASICGNGSFAMVRWLYDPYGKYNVIQLSRNLKNHEIQKVYPIDLTIYIENSVSDAEQLYRAGKIDCIMSCNTELATTAKGTVTGCSCRTLGLVANPSSPYANARIRQAFANTIDTSALGALPDGLQLANGILPPDVLMDGKSCREQITEQSVYTANHALAKAELSAALAELGVEDLPEGRIIVPAGWVDDTLMLELISQWKETLGLYLSLEEVTVEDYTKRLQKGDYTLAIAALEGDRNTPDALFASYLAHPAIDCLQDSSHYITLSDAVQAATTAEQYADIEQQILEEGLFLPLFYGQRYLICQENIADVQMDAFASVLYFSQAKCFD